MDEGMARPHRHSGREAELSEQRGVGAGRASDLIVEPGDLLGIGGCAAVAEHGALDRDGGIGGDAAGDPGGRADDGVMADDRLAAEDRGVGVDDDLVLDGRVALDVRGGCSRPRRAGS